MCAGVSVWAKVKTIVFSISRQDMIKHMQAKSNKKFSWRQINISCREVIDKSTNKVELIENFMNEEGLKLFDLTNR